MAVTDIKQVYSQLKICLTSIGRHEFPEKWGTILSQVKLILKEMNNLKAVYAALTAVYCLMSLYRHEMGEKRKNLELIIREVFDNLYLIAKQIVIVPGEESACLLKIIAKSFFTAIAFEVSPLLTKEEVFSNWLNVFCLGFERSVDPALETITEDEEEIRQRMKAEVFKVKKVIAKIFCRVYQNYANPDFSKENHENFVRFIEEKYTKQLLRLQLNAIQKAKSNFVHPHVFSLALQFVSQAIGDPGLYSIVSASLVDITNNCVFPKLLLSPSYEQIWNEDPHEFLKILYEERDNYNPRFAALDFINTACSGLECYDTDKEPYYPVLEKFLLFLNGIMESSVKEKNPRLFDAGLYALGNLEKKTEHCEILEREVEQMIVRYVVPNFGSPIGIVRTRCYWVYFKLAPIRFNNTDCLTTAFREIIKALKDKDLPVQVTAALAMSKLIQNESIAREVKHYISEIVSVYLKLMAEVELEDLVNSLTEIITTFGSSIRCYAINLIIELLNVYNSIRERIKDKEEFNSNENATRVASACLDTIGTILNIIGPDQSVLQQAEPLLIPIIYSSFNPEEDHSISSTIDILSALTYYSKKISTGLWELYPLLISITVGMPEEVAAQEAIRINGGWAYESLNGLITSIQNFVTRDPNGFLLGSCMHGTYIDLMFILIDRILEMSKQEGRKIEAIRSIKLIISMLEALKVVCSSISRASWDCILKG